MIGITSDYRTIRQLLEGKSFAIDEYQREYKWDTANIEELLRTHRQVPVAATARETCRRRRRRTTKTISLARSS